MSLIKIPRNIFQTWETKHFSNEFDILTQTWKYKNPNYAYFLFDSNDREDFIKKYFDENIYRAYCRIIPGAFKADLWRYCILFIYGGVYVDIDTICLNNIDSFLDKDIEFMTTIDLNNCPYYGTYNLSNAFIASIPRHPILMDCIKRIVYNIENNIIPFSNLDFSGPGILGKSTNTFIGNNENESFLGKEGIHNNTLKLLKFEHGIEYIKDIHTNSILFQNKNGNKMILDIYNNEIKNINYICWGNCKNPIKPSHI
jgi:mannosyltransferase OCH1-like enzyme